MPETFAFSTLLAIRITDLNYGAHVGNDTFLSLMHEARQQFLMQHGYKELDLGGYGVILADAAIEYKKELNYGDEIKISVAASDFDKYGFDLYYKVEIVTASGLILAGKAKTGILCYDYEKKKLVPIPEEVRSNLTG